MLFIVRGDKIQYKEIKSYEREVEVLNVIIGVSNENSVRYCNISVDNIKDCLMNGGT